MADYLTIIYTALVIGMVILKVTHIWIYFFRKLFAMNIIAKILEKVSQIMLHRLDFALRRLNEDFHIKCQKILKNDEKELIELLLLESETIIAKIQFEVDNSVNALFPEDQEEVRKYLKEKNRKLKEKLKNQEKRNGRSSSIVQIMGITH